MAILKCKMCGGDIELSADKTFGTCDSCGSTMTFPKVDDEQRANMFNRGNHFRRSGEFDKALAVYERIVQEDENDAEAHWCCALCRFGIEYVEDPNTFEYLPTCHRASFDSFLEDVDYLAALEHSDGITRRQYQKDAQKIAEVQRGILATSQNEEPFDVFICYKESENDGTRTRDSLLAQEIYYQLTEQGRRVFFSRITLEDKAGTEYEPYIFAALNSAKVMILVTTSAEHANSVWVKNEWSRFLSLMRKDRTKLLLPCYRDMDPYDLPEALSVLQSYDMSKIGFIQDLIRGVNKVLDASRPKETVKETVVIQQQTQSNTAPLLERAFMFLEDGNWGSANEYCEKVLDLDPKNAEAYLGKLMAELHVKTRDALKDQPEPFDARNNFQKALRFGGNDLKEELLTYLNICNTAFESGRGNIQKIARAVKNRFLLCQGCLLGLRSDGTVSAKYVGDQEYYCGQDAVSEWNDIIEITGTNLCVYGLKADGTVVATKYTGDKKYYHGQDQVSEWKDIVAVAGARGLTFGLKMDGTVVTTKYIGDPTELCGQDAVAEWRDIIAIAASSYSTIGLKTDGTVVATKYTGKSTLYWGQDGVSGWRDIIAIDAFRYGTIGLRADGTAIATKFTGDKRFYTGADQISDWKDIVSIVGGNGILVGLKSDGTVVATKYTGDKEHYHGQDQVSEWKDIIKVTVLGDCTIGLKVDGTVVATKYTGDQEYYCGQGQVSEWEGIVAIGCEAGRTFGLKMDGTVVATKYIGDPAWLKELNDVDGWQLFDSFEELEAANERIEESINLRKEQAKELMRKKAEEAKRQAAELRRREEAAAAALRAQKREECSKQLAASEQHKQSAETELANLKGLFSGKRRRELQETIEHNEKEIIRLQAELKQLQE